MLGAIIILIPLAGTAIALATSHHRYVKRYNDITSVSLKEFNGKIDKKETDSKAIKKTLESAKEKVRSFSIPIPEELNYEDGLESSLNKISKFFEEHSLATVGSEQFILSVLDPEQLGQFFVSAAEVLGTGLSKTVAESASAIKSGVHGIHFSNDSLHECATYFLRGIEKHFNNVSNANYEKLLISNHDYIRAISRPLTAGLKSAVEPVVPIHHTMENVGQVVSSNISDIGGNLAETFSPDSIDVDSFDVSGHIPYFTLAISSIREIGLLYNHKTNFIASLKNVGLDVIGTGGGALAGAQAGALTGAAIGSFFPGAGNAIGFIIGSIAGSIGGAMGGRSLTNRLKRRKLDNAIKKYSEQYTLMANDTKEKSRNALKNLREHAICTNNNYNTKISSTSPKLVAYEPVVMLSKTIYNSIFNELRNMRHESDELRHSIWFTRKYRELEQKFNEDIKSLSIGLESCSQLDPSKKLEALLSLKIPSWKSYNRIKAAANSMILQIDSLSNQNNAAILTWTAAIDGMYQEAMEDIRNFSNEEMKKLNDTLSSWKSTMKTLEEKVISEANKLGIDRKQER